MYEAEKEVVRSYLATMNGTADDINGPRLSHLADDIVYIVPGSTPISHVMRGIDEIQEKMWEPCWEGLEYVKVEVDSITAGEDGRIFVEARNLGMGKNGVPYHQTYLFVMTVKDGKVASIIKHCDTALIETCVFDKEIRAKETAAQA